MTYLATVLADTPLHYWRMADGTSAILHDIGSSPIHLLASTNLQGGYSGIDVLSGSQYGAFQLALQAMPVNPFSVECWFWEVDVLGAYCGLVAMDGAAADTVGLFVTAALQIQWQVKTVTITSPLAYAVQQWHHIVGTYTVAGCQLYVDGAPVVAGAAVGAVANTRGIYVGQVIAGARQLHGFTSELAIYNTALSAAQVLAHYNAHTSNAAPAGGIAGGPISLATGIAPILGDVLAAVGTSSDAVLASVRKTY